MGNYRSPDDTLVYYLGRPIESLGCPEQLAAFVDRHPEAFVFVNSKYLDEARFRDVSIPLPGKRKDYSEVYLLRKAED